MVICIDYQSLKAGFTTPFHFLAPQSYTFFARLPSFFQDFFIFLYWCPEKGPIR